MLILITVSLAGSGATAAPPDPFLITAGVGIGSVKLGVTIADLVRTLGTPKISQWSPKNVVYEWPELGGISATCTSSGEVIEVAASLDPRYQTAEGLHVGVTEQQVRSTLGTPSRLLLELVVNHTTEDDGRRRVLYYDALGIVFRVMDVSGFFPPKGGVSQVSVVKPKEE